MSKSQDGHDDLSSGLESLFRAARRAHDPTALERARVDAALASKLTGVVTATPGTAAKLVGTRTRMLGAYGGVKLSLGIMCVAAASLVTMSWSESRSAPALVAPRTLPTTPVITPSTPDVAREERESRTPQAAPRAFELKPAPVSRLEHRARRRVQATSPALASPELRSTTAFRATDAALRPLASIETHASDVQEDTTPRAPTGIAASSAVSVEPAKAQRSVDVSSPPPAPGEAARAELPDAARAELMFMVRIHAALKKADFSTALALCAEHRRRWPDGVFVLAREGAHAIASCGARAPEGGPGAQRFLAEHPHAPLAMRVRAACAEQLAAATTTHPMP